MLSILCAVKIDEPFAAQPLSPSSCLSLCLFRHCLLPHSAFPQQVNVSIQLRSAARDMKACFILLHSVHRAGADGEINFLLLFCSGGEFGGVFFFLSAL